MIFEKVKAKVEGLKVLKRQPVWSEIESEYEKLLQETVVLARASSFQTMCAKLKLKGRLKIIVCECT